MEPAASRRHRVDRIAEPWGTATPYGRGEPWPVRVDTFLGEGLTITDVDAWVPTASVLHSNGDGLELAVKGGRIVGVRGRASDRVNHGRLGPTDLYGWQANASPDRLTTPLVRRGGELVATDWDTAMDLVVARTQELRREHGPAAIAFYTSGQLFAEEYYALGLIAHGGIGTRHLDGNTRLCTATAAAALKESFGCDGQPGSYDDIDHCDVLALYGHNMAETQPVLWCRVLDRLAGPAPPRLVCVDPRETPVARAAAVHLAPRPGTHVALLNGLLHEIVARGWADDEFVARHTVGFDDLRARVGPYSLAAVADICDVPLERLRTAATLIGTAERLVSTVLQGFYQSHQATAAAVQVNNVHLVRGMLGRPGCGLLQMNGQPTSQNTRECGADGDLAGFRNWSNDAHVADLARHWRVDPASIPHGGPPTDAMEIVRLAEAGTVRFLWVSATNPAVSLPELQRVRRVLADPGLFLVVQDIFPTETTALADVVLPAAAWGEKTGTFTNADRTVHLSEQAVEPPGTARSDFAIFVDYAHRLGLRAEDGSPLVPWSDPESAFEAWKECSRGRPCDYSGLTYDRLRGPSGIQWPCTASVPAGTARLYEEGPSWAGADQCEDFGHDLVTGEARGEAAYRALNPNGKAMLRPAEHTSPPEMPDEEYPFWLTTGRTLYHFHTRTKTARAAQLEAAAPAVWVEISPGDAGRLDVAEGDAVEITTRRGVVRARVRLGGIRDGVVFLPFHYGDGDPSESHRASEASAANELTLTTYDPVSKQPIFKTAAARVTLVARGDGSPAPAPTTTASRPVAALPPTVGGTAALADEQLGEVSASAENRLRSDRAG